MTDEVCNLNETVFTPAWDLNGSDIQRAVAVWRRRAVLARVSFQYRHGDIALAIVCRGCYCCFVGFQIHCWAETSFFRVLWCPARDFSPRFLHRVLLEKDNCKCRLNDFSKIVLPIFFQWWRPLWMKNNEIFSIDMFTALWKCRTSWIAFRMKLPPRLYHPALQEGADRRKSAKCPVGEHNHY